MWIVMDISFSTITVYYKLKILILIEPISVLIIPIPILTTELQILHYYP